MEKSRRARVKISYDGTITQVAKGNTNGTDVQSTQKEQSVGTINYTVVSGDTLWAIAGRYLGAGKRWKEIYNANTDIIEKTAKEHGRENSDTGHWIYPGEVLTINTGNVTKKTTTQTSARTIGTSNPELGDKMTEALESFSYTDIASGQSDTISISMHDIDKEWMGNLKPGKGCTIGAGIITEDWEDEGDDYSFNCGVFTLDELSFSGRPLSCSIGAVSVPIDDDFKSLPKSRTWEKTTVRDIAQRICDDAGVALYYSGEAYQIKDIEQSNQTDSAFLYNLCERYGLAMKVYSQKIVIFDMVASEEAKAVHTIDETDMTAWSYTECIVGTYTGVKLGYTDPDVDESISVMLGDEGRMYEMNTQAYNKYDAELQAAAKVNAANRTAEILNITIAAKPVIVASQCVEISGLSALDGKYYVDKIVHSVGNGYTMKLSLHRIQNAIKVTKPAASAKKGGWTYTVVSGDTLWAISKKYYGNGAKYNIIYEANQDIIENTAKQHGKKDSGNGHWIWPGEVLTIPAAE